MDIQKALGQIKSNLDSVTAELKMSMPGGGRHSQYGTTLRTEIYTSEGGTEEQTARERGGHQTDAAVFAEHNTYEPPSQITLQD